MKSFLNKLLLYFIIALIIPFTLANAYYSLGEPTGYVNDFAQVFTPNQKEDLEKTLSQIEKETGAEIAVVTIKSLKGDTIENFANELFEEWGIGKKEEDNGILILTAIEDRKIRIEVGYGLEGDIIDAYANKIINQVVIPEFKKGNYYVGIKNAVLALQSKIKGQDNLKEEPKENNGSSWVIFWGVFIGLVPWLTAIMARDKSVWLGTIVGGLTSLFIVALSNIPFIYNGLFIFLLGALLGLFWDWIVSQEYKAAKSSNRSPRWWSGGSRFGGGSSSGGGFGGFGGGSSGGGGASGSW